MPRIFVKSSNTSIEAEEGKDLLQLLLENKVFVDNPCNGKGTCGKCKVKLLHGELPITETEQRFLKAEELAEGYRLSCLVVPTEDITIEVLQKETEHKILTKGYVPSFRYNPSIKKRIIDLKKPTLDNQTPLEDAICKAAEVRHFDWSLLQQELSYGINTAVYCGGELIALEAGDTTDKLYGVAVDIGTTTVVAALVDLKTGNELTTASLLNPQKKYGLDVLTRITYSIENPEESRLELQNEIVAVLNQMIEEVCAQAHIDRNHIYEVAVAANCTMLHFLMGVAAASIGRSPYAPAFVRAKNTLAEEIGIKIAKSGRLYCLPSVSAYIGADIVAGAYVCKLHESKSNTLFIDIGTNGEIVLSKSGKLFSCSCAAGPALEGMNISSGMKAAEGAIEDIEILEEGVQLKVIGDIAPIGICGSGILAAVKELIRIGLVRKDGSFIKKDQLEQSDYRYNMLQLNGTKREFVLVEGQKPLLITQGDLRQVQLAKGAILSGFTALLNSAGIDMNQLEKVMIAGQFGAHLPADSLIGTGILPAEVKDKLVYVGNTSKTGAYMALMSEDAKKEMEELAEKISYMELGASEGYEKLFAQCLIY